MKKILLLASAAIIGTSAMVAEDIDITPKAYRFNNCTELPLHPDMTFKTANHEANTWSVIEGEKHWKDGLITFVNNNPGAGATEVLIKGLQLVDLGGEVGKVLCYANKGSDVNEALKAITGYDYNIQMPEAGGPFFKLNFFMDPKQTPTKSEGNIKIKMTYHVYCPTSAKDIAEKNLIQNSYMVTDQVSTPDGATENANSTSAILMKDCWVYDEDEETDTYDNTLWNTIEWVTFCPDKDGDTNFAPMYLKTSFSNFMTKSVLFIKEVTFSQTTDATTPGERKRETLHLAMRQPGSTGINDVIADEAEFTYSVNGNEATFSADTEIFNMAGAKVANAAAAQSVSLAKGLYVARVGAKAVKFVVK